jgi:hypothetical protein
VSSSIATTTPEGVINAPTAGGTVASGPGGATLVDVVDVVTADVDVVGNASSPRSRETGVVVMIIEQDELMRALASNATQM